MTKKITLKRVTMFSNTEDRLLNFIYAQLCCLALTGTLWAFGFVP